MFSDYVSLLTDWGLGLRRTDRREREREREACVQRVRGGNTFTRCSSACKRRAESRAGVASGIREESVGLTVEGKK